MLKQIILPVAAVAAIVIGVGIFVQKSGKINIGISATFPTAAPARQKVITIGTKITKVDIAGTKSVREKGLSGVKSMDLDRGMLFIFDQKGVSPAFWMKGMLFPLDIIWIAGGKIVKIDKNIQPAATGTLDDQLQIYTASTPVDYVLEVNAGFSDNNGVAVGVSVDLSGI